MIGRVPLSILYKKCPNRVHVPARLVQTFLPLPTTIHHLPSIFCSPCSVHTLTCEIYRYCRKCVAFVGCLLMPGLYQRAVIPHFGFLTRHLRSSVPLGSHNCYNLCFILATAYLLILAISCHLAVCLSPAYLLLCLASAVLTASWCLLIAPQPLERSPALSLNGLGHGMSVFIVE